MLLKICEQIFNNNNYPTIYTEAPENWKDVLQSESLRHLVIVSIDKGRIPAAKEGTERGYPTI